MSHRLLRAGMMAAGGGSGVSAETAALLAAMDTAPSPAQIATIDAAMATVQTLASKLDYFIAPMHNDQASRINWIDPSMVATKVGATLPTFTPGSGWSFTFNGGSRLQFYNPSTFGGKWELNSAHAGFDITVAWGSASSHPAIATTSGTSIWVAPLEVNATTLSTGIATINSAFATGLGAFGSSDGTGHCVYNRSGASALQGIFDGVEAFTATTASTSIPNQTLIAGGSVNSFPASLGAIHFGGSLTAAECATLNGAIESLKAETWT